MPKFTVKMYVRLGQHNRVTAVYLSLTSQLHGGLTNRSYLFHNLSHSTPLPNWPTSIKPDLTCYVLLLCQSINQSINQSSNQSINQM